jgi:putative methionine-R-sulfoxide reductase with GAF domain
VQRRDAVGDRGAGHAREDVLAEIDIDSDTPAAFGQEDRSLLEAAAALLAERL